MGSSFVDNNGNATFDTEIFGNLSTGSTSFTASYLGDNNFNGSTSSSATVNVTQAESSTSLSAGPAVAG